MKRIIMMNLKIHKPNCFNIYDWLKHFMDLLSMEQATSEPQSETYLVIFVYEVGDCFVLLFKEIIIIYKYQKTKKMLT